MYVGMAIYSLRPGKKIEATRIWQESFFPVATQQRNCKAALWLVAPDMDKAIGIELWDLDVAASSFETSGLFQRLAGKFQNVLVRPPEREQFQTADGLFFTPLTPEQRTEAPERDSVQEKFFSPGFRIMNS
jgi:hypothetical protein